MVVALPELGALVILFTALALCLLAQQLAKLPFQIARGILSKIPLIGDLIGAAAHKVEQKINSLFAPVVAGLETGISATWHVLAQMVERMGHEIAQASRAAAGLTWYVTVKYPVKVLHSALRHAGHDITIIQKVTKVVVRQANAAAKALDHPYGGKLGAAVKAGTKGIDAGLERLDRWTRTQVAALLHATTVWLPGEIARLRGEVDVVGRTLRHLRALARRHERLLGAGAITAAVAFALGRLGGGWIRCTNWNRLGREVCRTPFSSIEGLLAILTAEEAIRDLPSLVREMQLVTRETVLGIQRIAQV